ncbi:hypothetical protein [Halovenus carboxidivorans]|uniref:hypothetical protein n=1 Tax=Halovenus carboxidivorans TaxID=2692199 RepID=UPI0034A1F1D3
MSTAVDVTQSDDEEGAEHPFAGDRIEIEESKMRSVVRHEVFMGRIKDRLDRFAARVIFGKSGE